MFSAITSAWVRTSRLFLMILAASIFLSVFAAAQIAFDPPNPLLAAFPFAEPQDRITRFVDDEERITLQGNRHPLALSRYDVGRVSPDYPLDRMLLTLLPDAAQQQALDQLLEAQHDPDSPYFHQWLSPEQYGDRFGVSESDIRQVEEWLQKHGMNVEEVTAGRRSIVFSGLALEVESAFHTQIHAYRIGDELHHANASDPEIPAALSDVVGGIVSLHDFRSTPMHSGARLPLPDFTNGSLYYLAPADFATIYNLAPIYQQSINGLGQSIAIVARSNLNVADVRLFRSSFGLPANDPQIVVNGVNPGIVSAGEETEAALDVEWAGAVARNATIKFVVSKSTNSSDGSYLSAQYIVNHNLAPVMSMSFSLCEGSLGSAGNRFINSLWQQAATQGITVFVASGDSGAAGCDSASASRASHGRAVNGLCSTPYNVCVGGTQFNDRNAPLYWSASNQPGTQSSALSYIPEIAWNESGPKVGLWSSSGGASGIYPKPSWQAGAGVPTDNKRDVPDVSLSAAGHDGYLIYQNGGLYVVGGTSAASPSFAGLMALVLQHAAARQGNADTVFYSLSRRQKTGAAAVFHDIISGTNSVPGQSGFTAAAGYDQVTGLGSVDAFALLNHWGDAFSSPAFQLSSSTSAIAINPGSDSSVILHVAVSGGFDAAVAFAVTGLPIGVIASFSPGSLSAPGSGTTILKIHATSGLRVGNYVALVSVTSGASKQQIPLSVACGFRPNIDHR